MKLNKGQGLSTKMIGRIYSSTHSVLQWLPQLNYDKLSKYQLSIQCTICTIHSTGGGLQTVVHGP